MQAILIIFLAALTITPRTVSSIDAFCDPLAKYAGQKENVPQIFADLSDHERGSQPKWSAVASKAELDRLSDEQGTYIQAFVWTRGGGTFVMMFFTSPSGDWAEYVDSCFLSGGSLARSVSTLNTFNVESTKDEDAPVSRIRTKHFAPTGRLLRSRTRVLNTKSRKPTRLSFMDKDESLFLTLEQLPFAAQLRERAGTNGPNK